MATNRSRATVPPFQPVETVSFQKHAEPAAAGALDPRKRGSVALVADGAIFAQLHPAACGTPRPLEGHSLKNASTCGMHRRLSLVIDHGSDPPCSTRAGHIELSPKQMTEEGAKFL